MLHEICLDGSLTPHGNVSRQQGKNTQAFPRSAGPQHLGARAKQQSLAEAHMPSLALEHSLMQRHCSTQHPPSNGTPGPTDSRCHFPTLHTLSTPDPQGSPVLHMPHTDWSAGARQPPPPTRVCGDTAAPVGRSHRRSTHQGGGLQLSQRHRHHRRCRTTSPQLRRLHRRLQL